MTAGEKKRERKKKKRRQAAKERQLTNTRKKEEATTSFFDRCVFIGNIHNYLKMAHFDIRLCQTLFLAEKERQRQTRTYSHLPHV